MDELGKVIRSTADFLEQENRGVQIGCYAVAVTGFVIALRRVRPFSKFRKPSDIPRHFVAERQELTGVVQRIEPSGALLIVNHKPLVNVPFIPEGQLPVKIAGVNVSGLGLSWLQAVVASHEVRFVPVQVSKDFVQCEVTLPQIKDNKPQLINVGESLVKIGFGCVVDDPATKPPYKQQLQQAENYALRRKLGLKYYIGPTVSALKTATRLINQAIQNATAKSVKLATT